MPTWPTSVNVRVQINAKKVVNVIANWIVIVNMKIRTWIIICTIWSVSSIGYEESYGIDIKDSRNTNNPNECWYQDEKGNISPCKIEGGPDMIVMFMVIFGPWILLGGAIGVIVIFWWMRK